jgi:SPP1 family predicted phage head-tail adaptor
MRVGLLRERVSIVNTARTDDGEGGGVATPAVVAPERLAAQVRSLNGRERLQAASSEVEVTHVVTLRAHPAIGPHTQLLWGTRELEVVGPPVEHDHGRWFECFCVERYR